MRLEKRAVAVAVAGLAAGALLGYWSGAFAGVSGALAGLVLAVAWQFASSWQGLSYARRTQLAKADAAFAPRVVEVQAAGTGSVPGGGWTRFLRPEAEVVGFWPRPELADLARWVASEQRVAARLVTGAGGSGKTRLARQLGELAADLGWRSWWVTAGQEVQAVRKAALSDKPVLLVLDYAETRPGLAPFLAAAAPGRDGPALRLLLLARSAGEWWQRLADNSPDEASDLIAGAGPVVLGPVAAGAGPDAMFAEALAAFAELRQIPCPDAELRAADRSAVVLVIHAAALLAVLNAETSKGAGGGDVLGGLLEHERRYWQQSLAARLPSGLDPDVIDRVVMAGFLVGASDPEEAMRLLEVIPDLGDGALRGTIARWLHDLYPAPADAGGREWIGQLQPDLLTEQLVTVVLARHPRLAGRLLAGRGEARAQRALTILARATALHDSARNVISETLRANLASLVIPASQVAIQTTDTIGLLLAEALEDASASLEDLIRIAEQLPYPTAALAGTAVVVTTRVRQMLPRDSDRCLVASWAHQAGIRLTAVGRGGEALQATQEAATIYRELARSNPDRFRPDLASSLVSLSYRYDVLDQPERGLPIVQEATEIYRDLAATDSVRYRPDLALALQNFGNRFSSMSRWDDALPSQMEAVSIRRELAAADSKYRPALANSLDQLGFTLHALGRYDKALEMAEDAAMIHREVSQADPDRYRADLGWSLYHLGRWLSELGRRDEAAQVAEEAVATHRKVVTSNPGLYRQELATFLLGLADAQSQLGLISDALSSTREAVAIRRDTGTLMSEQAEAALAESLCSLAVRLRPLRFQTEVLSTVQETVAIYSKLVDDSPGQYRSDLANSLLDLSIIVSELGRPADALPAVQGGIAIYRELYSSSPSQYRTRLIRALNIVASILSELQQDDQAMNARSEASRLGSQES